MLEKPDLVDTVSREPSAPEEDGGLMETLQSSARQVTKQGVSESQGMKTETVFPWVEIIGLGCQSCCSVPVSSLLKPKN